MSERTLRERVFASLDTAVDENGYTELLTHPPEAVAIDLLTAAGDLSEENLDTVEVTAIVIEWQDVKKEGRDV